MSGETHFDPETTKPASPRPNGQGEPFGKFPPVAAAGEARSGTGVPESDRDALYEYVKEQLAAPELHEEIQYELGRWVHLLEATEADLNHGPLTKHELVRRLVREAGAAIPALLSAKPELVFARTLRVQAEITLLRHNGWLTRNLIRMTGGSPVLTVCVGSLAALLAGLAIVVMWQQDVPGLKAMAPLDALAPTAIVAAYLGGLVSVMSRLHGFARLGDFEHVFLFSNALARPLIGAISGIFAYAALKSGLVPLDQAVVAIGAYQVWTIGFIAGFSERLANDLVSRGEAMLVKQKAS
jgi:hypothetical protein